MRRFHRHRGAVLVAALVCIGFASVVLLGTIQISLRYQRQSRQHQRVEQANWFVDAGVRKAITRWNADQSYAGETFEVALDPKSQSQATMQIVVAPKSSNFKLTVKVRFQNKNAVPPVIQRSKSILLPSASSETLTPIE